MDIRSLLRTCFVFSFVLAHGPVAAAPIEPNPDSGIERYADSGYEILPANFERNKFSAQHRHSLSWLNSIESWRENTLAQPYSEFESLYTAAVMAQQELDHVIREISLLTDTQAILPGIKSAQRAKAKIATELYGKTDQITDLARASLVANNISGLVHALELLNNEMNVVALKNRFKTPAASGYRDLKLLVRLPQSQVVAEVQLHLDAISVVKNGAEHDIYEQIQEIERFALQEERALTEFETAKIARLRGVSQQLYQQAWQQYLPPETLAS